MMITIPQPKRVALRWLAAWYVERTKHRKAQAEDYDTRKGAIALARIVPGSTPEAYKPRRPGSLYGQKHHGGVALRVPEWTVDPLTRLAAVYGVSSPQEMVRVFAQAILEAAPSVELDCNAEENFAAIDGLVATMREHCVQRAIAARHEELGNLPEGTGQCGI